MKIGVIGGGLTGLTAAYELAKEGHEVVLFEREAYLGGQASTFEVAGARLERYYHHIFTGDKDIIALIEELGLTAAALTVAGDTLTDTSCPVAALMRSSGVSMSRMNTIFMSGRTFAKEACSVT